MPAAENPTQSMQHRPHRQAQAVLPLNPGCGRSLCASEQRDGLLFGSCFGLLSASCFNPRKGRGDLNAQSGCLSPKGRQAALPDRKVGRRVDGDAGSWGCHVGRLSPSTSQTGEQRPDPTRPGSSLPAPRTSCLVEGGGPPPSCPRYSLSRPAGPVGAALRGR